jgi:hypothetical protein
VPLVGIRQDLGFGKPAELIADRIEFQIIETLAGPVSIGERRRYRCTLRRKVRFDQIGAGVRQITRGTGEAKVGRPEQLVLSHRQPTGQLRDRLGKGQLHNCLVKRGGPCALTPDQHRFERRDAGRHPGEAVRGALLRINRVVPRTWPKSMPGSGTFKHRRDALPAADAHRFQPIADLAALQLARQVGKDPPAGRADRMTQRDA